MGAAVASPLGRSQGVRIGEAKNEVQEPLKNVLIRPQRGAGMKLLNREHLCPILRHRKGHRTKARYS